MTKSSVSAPEASGKAERESRLPRLYAKQCTVWFVDEAPQETTVHIYESDAYLRLATVMIRRKYGNTIGRCYRLPRRLSSWLMWRDKRQAASTKPQRNPCPYCGLSHPDGFNVDECTMRWEGCR